MRSNALIALIASAVLLLAGCAEETADTSTVDDTTDSGTGGNESVDPGSGDGGDDADDDTGSDGDQNVTNTPPEASLDASAVSGTAPLNVTFTLDGSDADGDDLTWAFDADGDGAADDEGTELPATVNFIYTGNGTFNATLTVSDGANETMAAAQVTVLAGEQGPVVQEVSGEWIDGAVSCPHTLTGVFEPAPMDVLQAGSGVSWYVFEVDPATAGGTWTFSGDGLLITELDFYDTSGAYITYSVDGSGDIPPNAGYGVVYPCSVGPGTFEYVGTGP